MNKLSSVVLLAGFSTRMGELKQHVKIKDETFLQKIITTLTHFKSSFYNHYFIGQDSDSRARNLVEDFGGIWLSNTQPEKGPLSSIRIAINEMESDSDFLLWPVDHPMVNKETIERIISTWKESPDNNIIVPSIDMRRGHPTIFPAHMHRDFFIASLDKGAKVVLQKYPQKITYVNTDDIWVRKNINTPELLKEALEMI